MLVCWSSVAAQRSAGTAPQNDWQARLEALRPDMPSQYFELAEEVADQAVDKSQRDLARHLFALAGALEPHRLGRSACLALADLEEDELAKRRYLALAWLLASQDNAAAHQFGAVDRTRFQGAKPSPRAILGVTEALSRYRKGSGSQAQAALRKTGAIELLRQHSRHLPGGGAGGSGGADRFMDDLKLYRGQTKPSLSAQDVTRMLRFEAALLAGSQRSWSQEFLLTNARPLIEVDPNQLAESLGVDPTLALYRNGKWTAR